MYRILLLAIAVCTPLASADASPCWFGGLFGCPHHYHHRHHHVHHKHVHAHVIIRKRVTIIHKIVPEAERPAAAPDPALTHVTPIK